MYAVKHFFLLAVFAVNGYGIPFTAISQNSNANAQESQKLDKLGDPLPEYALMRFGTKRFVHRGGGPSMIALSVDEQTIFSMNEEWMMAWSTEKGKLIWQKPLNFRGGVRIGAAGYGVRPMCVFPKTGELVCSADNGSLLFWSPDTGESRMVKSPAKSRWKSIDIHSDSDLFAIGGIDGTWVCDSEGKLKYEILNNPEKRMDRFNGEDRLTFGGEFSYARFSPNGKVLALVNSEKPRTIQLFEASTGEAMREIKAKANIVRTDFSPTSNQIVTTERDNAARLYDLETTDRVWEFVIPPPLMVESYTSSVAFRPDGKQIAVGAPIGPDNRIRLLDASDGSEQGSLSGCGWKPWPMQFTRDSKFLYGSGWSSDIHKWNVDTQNEEPLPGGAVRASAVCSMSGDGKHLAYVDTNGIQLFDIDKEEISKTFNLADVEDYGQITFNDAGTQLAVGYSTSGEINVSIFDISTNEEIHKWSWAKGRDLHSSVEALAFSRDGKRVAAAVFRQSKAYVFDLPSNEQIAEVIHRSVYGMDINDDGSTLYTTGWDKSLRSWSTKTGEQVRELAVTEPMANGRGADTRAYGLALSHDQKMIATCDMTQTVRLFDRKLQPVGKIEKAGWFTFGAIAFSHNDLWCAVGTGQGAKVFDIASGEPVFSVDEHDEYIYTVDFGADDQTLISGGSDSVCYLWDIAPQDSEAVALDSTAFDKLVGGNGKEAYAAYCCMYQAPESAIAILKEELTKRVSQVVDEKDDAKSIIGLGSDSDSIRLKAKADLLRFGPAIDSQIEKQLESKPTDTKRESLEQIRQQISRRYRRATALLASLESDKEADIIKELMQKSKTKAWKIMLFDAMKSRKK